MKRNIQILLIGLILCNLSLSTVAQSESKVKNDTINLNTLFQTPVSPAASLIGISPKDIIRPKDVNDFEVQLQSASNNFSKLPGNFAVEFAPIRIINGGKFSQFDDFKKSSGMKVWLKNLTISLATKSIDTTNFSTTQVSVGVKLSIWRGNPDSNSLKSIDTLRKYLKATVEKLSERTNQRAAGDSICRDLEFKIAKVSEQRKQNDSQELKEYYKILAKEANDRLKVISNQIISEFNKLRDSTVVARARNLKITREGFKLDFIAGALFDFPGQNFSRGTTKSYGGWIVGGYDFKKAKDNGLAIFGIVRYLYNPNQILESSLVTKDKYYHTLDGGATLYYSLFKDKFSLSAEAIYRSVLNNNAPIDPSWRFTINAEYLVMSNVRLSLSFGKDYYNNYTKSGNLITALNLLMGFGSQQKVILK